MLLWIFVIFLAYRNAQLAQRKGQNTVLWVIATVFAFFLATIVGMLFLVLAFYNGPMDINDQNAMKDGITAFFNNPVRALFVDFSGIGGFLLVHYLLERMPDKQKVKDYRQEDSNKDDELF